MANHRDPVDPTDPGTSEPEQRLSEVVACVTHTSLRRRQICAEDGLDDAEGLEQVGEH